MTEALRRHADRYRRRYGFDPEREHVLNRILACRTAALGVHTCVCDACGWSGQAFNSCRDRHCPQCQGRAAAQWLQARQAQMLPTPHFQVVFTLPAELRPVAPANQKLVYGLLFRTAASILKDLASQHFEARMGITAVLHTWTSELSYHPHVHCLVTSGGLTRDDERWVDSRDDYLFPIGILGAMYRGRFLEGLLDSLARGDLPLEGIPQSVPDFRSLLRRLSKRHRRWVVHVEPPKGRPVDHVARYLARYVKRVAIADARIAAITDDQVTFKTRRGPLTLDGAEFVRRFLLHVLPSRFRKVRHYGLYAPGNARRRLEIAGRLLGGWPDRVANQDSSGSSSTDEPDAEEPDDSSIELCPACGARRLRRVFSQPSVHRPPQARGPP